MIRDYKAVWQDINRHALKDLFSSGINILPVDLTAFSKYFHICLIEDSFLTEPAITINVCSRFLIAYSPAEILGRQRFSIAHELGHIMLHHQDFFSKENEREADLYAGALLAPLPVLSAFAVNSAETIAALCKISSATAKIVLNDLQMYNTIKTYEKDPTPLKECGVLFDKALVF